MNLLQIALLVAVLLVGLGMVFAVGMLFYMWAFIHEQERQARLLIDRLKQLEVRDKT